MKSESLRPEEKPFDSDSAENGGFLYTTNAPLSSQIANKRLSDATTSLAGFGGKSIIDVGCGDGAYTVEFSGLLPAPRRIVGVDPANEAIKVAKSRNNDPRLTFLVGSAYQLPFESDSFDFAILRGVLHHMQTPEVALKESFRVARQLIIIEPNGWNPALKVIEKVSRYHRVHDERSYTSRRLNAWIGRAGGCVVHSCFVGLVPFFCPRTAALLLKKLEPIVEQIPGLRALTCAVAVILAERSRLADSRK